MKHLGVISFSILVFFLQGPSYVYHMASRLPEEGDSIVNSWILAWNAHALFKPGLSVWDSPLFYPADNALTFSETLFGNLWLTIPVQLVTGNHVLAFNVLLFVSFVLSAFAVYLLAYELTGHYWASLVAGILFSFNPYRWFHASHLQLLPIFWTPMAFLFAIRFFRREDKSSFFLMLLMIWIQYYTCIYLGTMLAVTLMFFTVFYFWIGKRGRDRFRLVFDPGMLKLMLFGLAGSLLVLLPLVWPYIQTARRWNFTRSILDNSLYSAEPLSFFFGIPDNSAAWGFLRGLPFDVRSGEGAVFLGLVPIILVVVNLLMNRRPGDFFNDNQKLIQRSFFWTGLVLMVLMLGPKLIVFDRATEIPLPYQIIYYLFPGAQAMRVPARYFQLLLLCVSVLAAFSVAGIMKQAAGWARWKRWGLPLVFVVVFCFDYAILDDPGETMETVEKMPPVYRYLAEGTPGSPILEIPVMKSPYRRLHYQTAHWRPKVGGISGWIPPGVEKLAKVVDRKPSSRSMRSIARSGAETVAVHLNLYGEGAGMAWQKADLSPIGFRFAGRFGDALVWEKIMVNSVDSIMRLKGQSERQ